MEIGESLYKTNPNKVSEMLSQKPSWVWCCVPLIPVMWEVVVGGLQSKVGKAKAQDPICETN
jgi:hypothetical protein